MSTQYIRDRLARIKDVVDDITDGLDTDALNESEAHGAVVDISSIAWQREATFRFAFRESISFSTLRTVLAALSQKHNVDPGYVMVSAQDYNALIEEAPPQPSVFPPSPFVAIHISNDHTGSSARLVASSDIEAGEAVFGGLYAPAISQAVTKVIGDS